ncbi:MAG: HAD family hydrolase [Oscillospiraceae bacterium]|jgi:HAD superfamily hydrolase (TIGR01509 family)
MKISGVIFDMDGTVTDSMFVWKDIGKRYLLARGLTPKETLFEEIKNLSLLETCAYFREVYGLRETDQEIAQGVNDLVEPLYLSSVGPKPGVIPLLENFKARGIPMVLATATDRYLVEETLEKIDLLKYFKAIFTCSEVGAGKTAPDVYEAALACLGTPKDETPVFEDAWFALSTAKRAGFPTVAVYDDSQKRNWETMKQEATVAVTDYKTDLHLFT